MLTQVFNVSFVLQRDRLLSPWARSYGDVQGEVAAARISRVACEWISPAASDGTQLPVTALAWV